MTPELQNKLFEKYPKIFRQKDLPMDQTCMCWGIDTGDGWYNIIDTLCGQIQWHIKHNLNEGEDPEVVNVEAVQVKEKYGGLRFYYSGGNDFISGLVYMAEGMSEKSCEECGAPGTSDGGRWVVTLCKPCHAARKRRKEEDRLGWEQRTQGGNLESTVINEHGDDDYATPTKDE